MTWYDGKGRRLVSSELNYCWLLQQNFKNLPSKNNIKKHQMRRVDFHIDIDKPGPEKMGFGVGDG